MGNENTLEPEDFMEALEQAHSALFAHDVKQGLQIYDALVLAIESNKELQENDQIEYHSFYEPYEEILYQYIYDPDRISKNVEIPCSQIYQEFGSLLFEWGQYDSAKTMLAKAMHWNPTNAKTLFAYMELYKHEKDMEQYVSLNQLAFHIAFHPDDLAKSYRNMSYYLESIGEYPAALGCLVMSAQFERENLQAKQEIRLLKQKVGPSLTEPSQEEMEQYGERFGFPMGADPRVIAIAFSLARDACKKEKYAEALYYYQMVYNMTDDAEVLTLMEQLPLEQEDEDEEFKGNY